MSLMRIYWTFLRWTSLFIWSAVICNALSVSHRRNLQDEISPGRDVAGEAPTEVVSFWSKAHVAPRRQRPEHAGFLLPLAVAVVTGDVEGGLFADLHRGDALIPACERVSQTVPIYISPDETAVAELTLDDLTDTNARDKVAAAHRGVEPKQRWADQRLLPSYTDVIGLGYGVYSLLALVVGLAGVLEPAGVLDGDLLALLGHGPVALLEDSLGDTHFAVGILETADGLVRCRRSSDHGESRAHVNCRNVRRSGGQRGRIAREECGKKGMEIRGGSSVLFEHPRSTKRQNDPVSRRAAPFLPLNHTCTGAVRFPLRFSGARIGSIPVFPFRRRPPSLPQRLPYAQCA